MTDGDGQVQIQRGFECEFWFDTVCDTSQRACGQPYDGCCQFKWLSRTVQKLSPPRVILSLDGEYIDLDEMEEDITARRRNVRRRKGYTKSHVHV